MQQDHENNLRNSLKELKSLPSRLSEDFNSSSEDDTAPAESFRNCLNKESALKKDDYSVLETSVSLCGSDGVKLQNPRQAGRYRLADEDKAKAKSFRLTNTDLELLSFAPGDNDTKKLRYILNNQYRYQIKMHKYARRLKKSIADAYHDLRRCVDPQLHCDDNSKKRQLIGDFKESYLELVSTIEFFEFDSEDFKELLDKTQNSQLSAILMGKGSLL